MVWLIRSFCMLLSMSTLGGISAVDYAHANSMDKSVPVFYDLSVYPSIFPLTKGMVAFDSSMIVSGELVKNLQAPVLNIWHGPKKILSLPMVADSSNNALKGHFMVDTSALKANECFEGEVEVGGKVVSPNRASLCATSLPVSAAYNSAKSPIVDSQGNKYVADQMIVKFRSPMTDERVLSFVRAYGADVSGQLDFQAQGKLYILTFSTPFPDFKSALAVMEKIKLEKEVETVELNGIETINDVIEN